MADVKVAGSLIPSTTNTPLDKRSRVATLADVASMENPVKGALFYCEADGKTYRITALKSKTIGPATVANAAVDTYEVFGEGVPTSVTQHIANEDIHVTASEKQAWDGKAAGDHNHNDTYDAKGSASGVQTNLNTHTANSNIHVTAEDKARWNAANSGYGHILGGYTVPVIGYEETTANEVTTYTLLLSPDTDEVDFTKFSAGQTLYLSIGDTVPQDDDADEDAEEVVEYLSATIATIDETNKKLTLTASLYSDTLTSTNQIGMEKKTLSGYTASATGGPSVYRVTLSGAGNDDALFAGRKIYTRAGTGVPASNTIAGTSGNYLYLSSAAAGTTAIYLSPTNALLSDKVYDNDEAQSTTGEHNFVTGLDASATGSWNVINGTSASASGGSNTVIGDFSEAHGANNVVIGNTSFAIGGSNQIHDAMSITIGNSNKLYKQGGTAIGDGNTISAVNGVTLGWNNKVQAYGGISVGTSNTVTGKNSFSLGYSNKVAAETAFVTGRYANVTDIPENKNAFIIHGGENEDNAEAFAVRCFKSDGNPLFDSTKDEDADGVDSTGEKKIIPVVAYETEFMGHLTPKRQEISATGTVVLDHDRYSSWKLTGSGSVNVTASNWKDGDWGLIYVNTLNTTPSFPAGWQIPDGFDITTTPGEYLLEARMECGGLIYLHQLLPYKEGTAGAAVTVSGTNEYSVVGTEDTAITDVTFDAVASNGGAVSYSLSSGVLPDGITLSNGKLTGTPEEDGSFVAVISATSGSASMNITVNIVIAATGTVVLSGKSSRNITGTKNTAMTNLPLGVKASDGSTVTYAIQSGQLPSGITLSSSGVLSGTPGAAGSSTAVIRATSGTATFDVTIVFSVADVSQSSGPYGILYDPSVATASEACQKVQLVDGELVNVDSFGSLPAHNFRRCVMDNLSTRHVNYYLHPNDSDLKEDGTAADLTGTDGDVMVEIPVVYVKIDQSRSDGKILYLVWNQTFTGASPHPFFYVGPGGATARTQYVGAFRSALCESNGTAVYVAETATSPATYSSGRKGRSIAGCKPWTNMSRATALTAHKAAGGHTVNHLFYEFLGLMMAIEGGSFDTQTTISEGFLWTSGWNYNYARLSGRTSVYGNGTGNIMYDETASTVTLDGVVYNRYKTGDNGTDKAWNNSTNNKVIYTQSAYPAANDQTSTIKVDGVDFYRSPSNDSGTDKAFIDGNSNVLLTQNAYPSVGDSTGKINLESGSYYRYKTSDSGSAKAWKDSLGNIIYTTEAYPTAGSTAYGNTGMTASAGTITSISTISAVGHLDSVSAPGGDFESPVTFQSGIANTKKVVQFSYRGIENPYGEIGEFAEGIVVAKAGDKYYWTKDSDAYTDSNYSSNYNQTVFAWATNSGYIKEFDYVTFLPKSTSGSSSTYLCDYGYCYTGGSYDTFVVRGCWNSTNGAYGGAFCVNAYTNNSFTNTYIGARLAA